MNVAITRKTTEAVMDGNPRRAEIEAAWQPIRSALSARNGREAGSLLAEIRDRDRYLFNACYWRVDRWLDSWFESRASGAPEDANARWEAAKAAKVDFMAGIYTDRQHPDQWQTADLAFLLQELPSVVAYSAPLVAGGASNASA